MVNILSLNQWFSTFLQSRPNESHRATTNATPAILYWCRQRKTSKLPSLLHHTSLEGIQWAITINLENEVWHPSEAAAQKHTISTFLPGGKSSLKEYSCKYHCHRDVQYYACSRYYVTTLQCSATTCLASHTNTTSSYGQERRQHAQTKKAAFTATPGSETMHRRRPNSTRHNALVECSRVHYIALL